MHVEGWWRAARENSNILFLHYEEMLSEPRRCAVQIANHLAVELSARTLDAVLEKSSYAYMKRHEDRFEMSAPTPFVREGSFFVKGDRSREADLTLEDRRRVCDFVREGMQHASYPLERFYPDVVAGT